MASTSVVDMVRGGVYLFVGVRDGIRWGWRKGGESGAEPIEGKEWEWEREKEREERREGEGEGVICWWNVIKGLQREREREKDEKSV